MSPSKYREFSGQKVEKKRETHPIWRGVGFAFIILIPIMAYAGMDVLLKQNATHNWFPLPVDLMAKPGELLYALIPDPLLYIKVALFVFIAFLFYLVFLLLASIITRAVMGNPMDQDPYYVPQMAMPRRRRR